MDMKASLVDVDWDSFEPSRIQAVRHRLMYHPLLRFYELVELGKRLELRRCIRSHGSGAAAGTPFNAAPDLHPNARSVVDTLQDIYQAQAWMSLLNVQVDETYRALVDEVLGGLKPGIDRVDPGMGYRGGWIFITSPNAVTPFHFDKEHNFILQVQGRKTLYVWDRHDTFVASDRARDRFHACHERDLLDWKDAFRERAKVFHLEPGMGAYMPSTSPHMVENGEAPSVTVSFTYYTDATRRDSLLHRANERLRGLGLEPPGVGKNKVLDACLLAGFGTAATVRDGIRRLAGKPMRSDRSPYACVGRH
ncbi:hypothetical protein SAMN05428989_1408 [Pseudoxanthomonas sp. GM95]|uniref:JmjC domain-containing protein n=1 Tax=Pseudoxanthomonas sp. GM95 TaxID=1881043 RepID=UPI0008B5EF2D|nr:cupin domain-containing protein [Pseudoxanthomonas sp. GM95]SEL09116.1 hypothetical protein SAMN05428989_1408 [Pseudoxanthomonas sp. GM95]